MIRTGNIHHWNNSNGSETVKVQLPEPSTLKVVAEAVITSSGRSCSKLKSTVIKTDTPSAKPHPILKDATILNFPAQIDQPGMENSNNVFPVSVLMKKASPVELQAYSTLFKDLQPDSTKNIYSILQGTNQQGHLYNLVPRAYLVQKPYIFLEDLEHVEAGQFRTAQDYRGHKQDSLDFNHCLLAVETLARFHASSYILRRQLGVKGKGKLEMLQKYPFLQQQSSHYSNRMSSQLAPVFEQAFDLAVRVIQQENPSLAFKLQRKVVNPESIFDKVVKLLEEEKYDNDDFYVVCHGNFQTDNLLFSYDKSGNTQEPTQCRIINFDSIFFGPLGSDLALFLFTCTTLEFRLEFEEKLLAFYCDAFQEQLVARYGRNSPTIQDFEENIDEFHRKVEKQYKKMMEFAFYNACVLLPIILYSKCNGATDATDNNNDVNFNGSTSESCSSIKDLVDGNQPQKYFVGGNTDFEKFALENAIIKERLVEIVKQLAKFRVLL